MKPAAYANPVVTGLLVFVAIFVGSVGSGTVWCAGPATPRTASAEFDDPSLAAPTPPEPPARQIGEILGLPATTAGDVVRVVWPRDDVPVTIDRTRFPAAAGLTSWAAFARTPGGSMVMGDTVVFEDEVSPAMDAALEHGLEITGLHNHFFYDEPKVYFMHIGGDGDSGDLARGVKATWDAIREVRRKRPMPATSTAAPAPSPGTLDAAAIGHIIGEEPSVLKGVVKVTLGREAMMHGAQVGGALGLTTWAAFAGSDEVASMAGDFAMTAAEAQPVLRALRKAGIQVVALHNHMIGETPAFYFTHFWARGRAADLARGFRSALDAQREAGRREAR